MQFTCTVKTGCYPSVISVVNPVSGTEVKITPEFTWSSMADLGKFLSHLDRFFYTAWVLGSLDPVELTSAQWLPEEKGDEPALGQPLG